MVSLFSFSKPISCSLFLSHLECVWKTPAVLLLAQVAHQVVQIQTQYRTLSSSFQALIAALSAVVKIVSLASRLTQKILRRVRSGCVPNAMAAQMGVSI